MGTQAAACVWNLLDIQALACPAANAAGGRHLRIEGGGKIGRLAALSKFRRSASAQQTIWIVEDDRFDRLIINRMVAKTLPGAECLYFEDVLSVLEHAQGNAAPALILSDVNLQASDGADLVRVIRSNVALAHLEHVPILVLTGSDDEATRQRCLDAGANAVIGKKGMVGDGLDFSSLLKGLLRVA